MAERGTPTSRDPVAGEVLPPIVRRRMVRDALARGESFHRIDVLRGRVRLAPAELVNVNGIDADPPDMALRPADVNGHWETIDSGRKDDHNM